VVFDSKAEQVLRYIALGGFGPGYGVALTPGKQRLYIPLGTPAQSVVAVVDAQTLTVVANIWACGGWPTLHWSRISPGRSISGRQRSMARSKSETAPPADPRTPGSRSLRATAWR
jgi:hypothetical protein